MTVDGLKLPQSLAIARYIAKQFNLAGASDLDQAKADAVVDTCMDMQIAYYTKVFRAKDEEKEAAKKSYIDEDAPGHLAKIDKIIGLFGSNGFSVGSSLTWADLLVWETTTMMNTLDASLVTKHANIMAVRKSVEANQKVAEYIKSRPQTPF